MNSPEPNFDATRITKKSLAVVWWVLLLRGLLLLTAGLFVFSRPGLSATIFIQVVGVLVLFEGILALIECFSRNGDSRGWSVFKGLLLAMVGIFAISQPAFIAGFAAITVLYLVATVAVIHGTLNVIGAVRTPSAPPVRTASLFNGILTLILGLILFLAPISFGLLLIRILATFAIFTGLVLLFLAFRIHKARRVLET